MKDLTFLDWLAPARTSQFLGADSGAECAALWQEGAVLWLVVGGQSGGWANRERVWIHDRLPGGPHQDKAYSGYWAGRAIPTTALAKNLGVTGLLETTGAGFPVARVVGGAPFAAQWEGAGSAIWRVQLLGGADGAVYYSADTAFSSAPLPALPPGASAMLRVRAQGAAPSYQWPPPNYASVSGEGTDMPSRFAWTHPNLGRVYYDPRFSVGARPYDSANPIQAALLDAETAAIQNKSARKIPEWVSWLFEFDSNGARISSDGEWSMLRVVSGDGAWVGDANVHPLATTPALWRVPLDPQTLEPSGPLSPWTIDPALRMVGALEIAPSGALLVGGALAGLNGPIPALYEIQSPDQAGDESTTETTLSLFICECVEQLGKGVRGIAQTATGLRAVSPCDSFHRDQNRSLFRRLIPFHPGGRNALTWHNGGRENTVFSTEGGDFATSDVHQKSHGYIVIETALGRKTGAPLAKQLDSCLTTLGGRVLGVEEWSADGRMGYFQTLAERLKSYQALGASSDGAQWDRLVSWQIGDFDAGPVARVGGKKTGAALWCFGTTGEGLAMKPRALRVQGSVATQNIDSDYFIQRVSTFAHRGEELMVALGLKHDAQSGFGREQLVLISRGEDGSAGRTVCAFWNAAASAFRMTRTSFTAAGGDVLKLPPFLVWRAEIGRNAGGVWVAASAAPASGAYLTLDAGETLIAYGASAPLPYDAAIWLRLCFEIGGDGGVLGPFEPPLPCPHARCSFETMPDGTRISLVPITGYEGQIGDAGQIVEGDIGAVAFYPQFQNEAFPPVRLTATEYEVLYPQTLWLRVDAETPLLLEPGDAITPAVLAELETFDQGARHETRRFLAMAAKKRVEALILLAPGWEMEARSLKGRS